MAKSYYSNKEKLENLLLNSYHSVIKHAIIHGDLTIIFAFIGIAMALWAWFLEFFYFAED